MDEVTIQERVEHEFDLAHDARAWFDANQSFITDSARFNVKYRDLAVIIHELKWLLGRDSQSHLQFLISELVDKDMLTEAGKAALVNSKIGKEIMSS